MDGVPLRSTHAPPSACEEHAYRQSGPERTGTVPENLLGRYNTRACYSAGEEDDGPRYFFAGPDPHGRSADQSSLSHMGQACSGRGWLRTRRCAYYSRGPPGEETLFEAALLMYSSSVAAASLAL